MSRDAARPVQSAAPAFDSRAEEFFGRLRFGPDRRLKGAKLDKWIEETIGDRWARFPPCDADEDAKRRLKQAIYLSRYGSEPISIWEDKPVWVLDDAYAEMGRLIARENGDNVIDDED